MIVVDANVILYLVRETKLTGLARRAYEKDPDWVAPSLWEPEVMNALLGEVRLRVLELGSAVAAIRNAADVVRSHETRYDHASVLQLSAKHGLTAYDACYAALAHALKVPLLTEDRLMLRQCPGLAVSLQEFVGGPTLRVLKEQGPKYGVGPHRVRFPSRNTRRSRIGPTPTS